MHIVLQFRDTAGRNYLYQTSLSADTATILSKRMKVKDMFTLKLEREGERKISAFAMADVLRKKILLLEDMLETGRGLIAGKKFLEERGAEVKTACLYTMPQSEIVPDFFLRQVAEVQHFPWE